MVAMNKLVIPAILVALVVVAVGFAVMPVEHASTVHTTVISTLGNLICKQTSGGVTNTFNSATGTCV